MARGRRFLYSLSIVIFVPLGVIYLGFVFTQAASAGKLAASTLDLGAAQPGNTGLFLLAENPGMDPSSEAGASSDAFTDTIKLYFPIVQSNGAEVCGEILTDTIWNEEESPYLLTCDVVVTDMATLTITAGTQVLFEHPMDDLNIYGRLQVLGTQESPVRFRPLRGATPGSWGGVNYMWTSSGLLDHVVLEYGGAANSMLYVGTDQLQILDSVFRYSATGGISIEFGSPLISGTQFISNTSPYGGGLYIDSSSPHVVHNIFAGNSAVSGYNNRGGGLYTYSGSPVIEGNLFIHNSAVQGGGIYNDMGSPIIQNNIFTGNLGAGGGVYNESGSPILQNNTIVSNTANAYYGTHGGGIFNSSGTPWLINNIVANNTSTGDGGGIYNINGKVTLDYNDVWNNSGGNYTGTDPGAFDISTKPGLVDPASGDFHLVPGSACIDAGDPDHHPDTDFEGDPRPMGMAPDIGVDETRSLRVRKAASPVESPPGGVVVYSIDLANLEAVTLTNVLLTDTLPVEAAFDSYQADGLNCSHDGPAWGGILSCVLDSSVLAPGEGRALTISVTLTGTFPAFGYVTNNVYATASAGGESITAHDRVQTWVTWCTVRLNDTPMGSDLQGAVDASTQPSDIVKIGGYCTEHDLILNKNLTLQGGWRLDFGVRDPSLFTTTLDAQSQGGVIRVVGEVSPTIEGLVITGGYLADYVYFGGGISIASGSPTIQNNIIMGNFSPYGGGLSVDTGSPLIQDNTFQGNQAIEGGGLINGSGHPVILNNTFTDNLAAQGGGLSNKSGSPTVQNNLFLRNINDNLGSTGGGLYSRGGDPIIQHNTFISNTVHDYGAGLATAGGDSLIQDNTFTGNNGGYGGGLSSQGGSSLIQDNVFDHNTAMVGGGVYIDGAEATVQDNTFTHNWSGRGGGLAILSDYLVITVQNNIVMENEGFNFGGGIYTNYDSLIIQNNTIVSNTSEYGGGVCVFSGTPVIRSNIISNNNGWYSGGGGIFRYAGTPFLDYNDVWNNNGGDYGDVSPGVHDISANPLLVDPTNGDFHLTAGSSCIDKGDPANYPPYDFEGDPRPNGAAPDIGADEYYP